MPKEKHQSTQPGKQNEMEKKPDVVYPGYHASGKLKGEVAIITRGDSGIGRSVAVYFAMNGGS